MVSKSCLVSFPYYREMIPTSPIFVIFSTNHHFFERFFFFWLQQNTTKNRVAFGMIFLWCVGWWRCYSRCLPPWGFLPSKSGNFQFFKWENSAAFFQGYHKKRLVKQYFLARNLWTKKFFLESKQLRMERLIVHHSAITGTFTLDWPSGRQNM